MMNHPNGDQVERNCDLVLINFLEHCWQLETAAHEDEPGNMQLEYESDYDSDYESSEVDAALGGEPSGSLIEIDETGQGYPALSRSRIAMWSPLIWLYL